MTSVLVVCDVDSTLIRQEVIELLADRAGAREEVARVTARAMAGELDFAQSLRERVRTLEGLSVDEVMDVYGEIVVTPGVRELIDGVHGVGGRIGAVSGGFSLILNRLAADLGLDYWRANELEVRDGRLTGRVAGDIVDAAAKRASLEAWAGDAGVPLGATIAVGDGANDLKMMEVAGLSVALHAKPIVRAQADLVINEPDLSPLLAVIA